MIKNRLNNYLIPPIKIGWLPFRLDFRTVHESHTQYINQTMQMVNQNGGNFLSHTCFGLNTLMQPTCKNRPPPSSA